MADTEQVLNLAAIIREVDGGNNKGAAALAESILDHPRFRAVLADGPAVPEGREPVSVTGQPSDEELDDWRSRCADLTRLGEAEHYWAFDLQGEDVAAVARAAIARWGNPAPLPPAKGEVVECTAELEEQKPRPDYDRVQKIATEAQIRSAAQYLAKKQHCDGDLIPAIRYAIARWGNPAPQPPAEGEVAELAEFLRAWAGDHYGLGHHQFTRAADLLQRQCPQPVPVSERLPEAKDCVPHPRTKAGNWCWGFERCEVPLARPALWRLMRMETVEMEASHWLPAHALPIPQQQQENHQ